LYTIFPLFCIALSANNHRNLLLLVTRCPNVVQNSKAIAKPRHNPYRYRLPGPFLGSSEAFLRTAKGEDPEDKAINDDVAMDDDVAIDDIRCWSWTCEQKLGAIKYATSTYVPGKTGSNELIANHAAAFNIGCTPKMLRT
jgi:hypothetical protein